MAEFPILQFSTDAFVADTPHLDATETGAYLMLLFCAWRSPDCSLPNDDKKLARMARCNMRVWHRIKDDVMSFWTLDDAGQWSQKRLLKERLRVTQRSQLAKQSADAKWLKYKNTCDPNASETHMRNGCEQHANQNKNQNKNQKEKKEPRANALVDEFNSSFWPTYPHKVGKPPALKSYLRARKTASMEEISEGLRSYIAAKPPDRSWLNPATFLNQERWNDTPARVDSASGQSTVLGAALKNMRTDDEPSFNSGNGTGNLGAGEASGGGNPFLLSASKRE